MKAIVICGATGRGKTTVTKSILKRVGDPYFLFDVNGEYKEFNNRNTNLSDINKFHSQAVTLNGHVILYEEATAFFKNSQRVQEVVNLIVRKWHTKNFLIFCFHSLRAIPIEIMDYVDYLYLFHTGDRKTLIESKYRDDEKIMEIFLDVWEKTEGTEKDRRTGVFKDERSKRYFHYSRLYKKN